MSTTGVNARPKQTTSCHAKATRRENGWINPVATSNILPVTDELTDRECRQAQRIGQGSHLVTSIALASMQLRKLNRNIPKEFRYRSREEFFLKHGRLYHPRKFPAKYRLLLTAA